MPGFHVHRIYKQNEINYSECNAIPIPERATKSCNFRVLIKIVKPTPQILILISWTLSIIKIRDTN